MVSTTAGFRKRRTSAYRPGMDLVSCACQATKTAQQLENPSCSAVSKEAMTRHAARMPDQGIATISSAFAQYRLHLDTHLSGSYGRAREDHSHLPPPLVNARRASLQGNARDWTRKITLRIDRFTVVILPKYAWTSRMVDSSSRSPRESLDGSCRSPVRDGAPE